MRPNPLIPDRPPGRTSGSRSGLAAAWVWTVLGLVLGGALPLWPYTRACGSQLWLYCGAVFVLLIVGIRAALITWRERVGSAHAVALLVTLWGLTLAAGAVLPRVDYAKTRAAWACGPEATVPRQPR